MPNCCGWLALASASADALELRGIPFHQVHEREVFQFGSGAPEVSRKAFLYPVAVGGQLDVLRISCVHSGALNCLGLVGPSELARWQVVFDFAAKTVEIFGKTGSNADDDQASGPPLHYPEGVDVWEAPEMRSSSC